MTIQLITEETPACYGVMCELHRDCSRYRTVENMPSDTIVIGTCATPPAIDRPLFAAIKAASK